MNDPLKEFGKRLRELRKYHRYSQESLALACGLDRTYIGGVERGERNISLLNICKVAEVLHVTPSQLLNYDLGLLEKSTTTLRERRNTKYKKEKEAVVFRPAPSELELKGVSIRRLTKENDSSEETGFQVLDEGPDYKIVKIKRI